MEVRKVCSGWLERLTPAGWRWLWMLCTTISARKEIIWAHTRPYFTDRYRTPWGEAINYDGAGSDEVRRFFRENALYWLEQYHFDALRLDAVHGIFDFSAFPFLAELKTSVAELSQRLGRQIHLIAESDQNDARVLRRAAAGDTKWMRSGAMTFITRCTRC